MALIDLVVVNYNTRDKLQRLCNELVNGAADYDDDLYNLIVVDNGSTDGSLKMLRTHPPKNINQIIYNENIGYARASNSAATFGTAPIIGILNADVWLNAHHVYGVVRSFFLNQDMAIMGPKQRDENGYITHAGIEGSNVAPKHRGWKTHDPKDELFRDFKEMVTVSGSAYFVRRDVWKTMTDHPDYQSVAPGAEGAFLPTPHYFEETFCSYFARHLGYKIFYDGRISIGHSWHASHEHGSPQDRMFQTSKGIFVEACDKLGIKHD